VEIHTDDRTDLGNRTVTGCTTLEKLGLLNSNQLSQIESSSTNPTAFSTGNAPKKLHVHNCYMAEVLEPEPEPINRKKEITSASSTSPTRNLTPVTIMVADTFGTVRSRRLLKDLLDSGSTTTLINKKCLPRKCQPCPISQSRMVNTLATTVKKDSKGHGSTSDDLRSLAAMGRRKQRTLLVHHW
jgi:hypothetical protein